jgi:hypothetical protein
VSLPTDGKQREEFPLYTYHFDYFPDAFLEEVRVSWVGNQQHNPGEAMRWAREKSSDHMNKAFRHLWDYGRGVKKDTDNTYHLAKVIWRLKARLQLDIEAERNSPQATVGGAGTAAMPAELWGGPNIMDSPRLGCPCDACKVARRKAGARNA